MAFKTDKQRKAFFAKQGTPHSAVNPSFSQRISNIKEKLRQRKEQQRLKQEQRGEERIVQEKVKLQHEQEQAERLRRESKVQFERESVAQQRRSAQKEMRDIERARLQRRIAPFVSGARKTVEFGKRAVKTERKIERKFKGRPARKKAKPAKEADVSPFGIDF